MTRPVTSSSRSARNRLSAATCPSGSSPCTPPTTSAVGPSPFATTPSGSVRFDQPLVSVTRGSRSCPMCFPARSSSIVADTISRIVDNPVIVDKRVRITDVEAIVLRQPEIDEAIADGSQDDLVIRVHTDEGLVGIGEVDSSPEVCRAVVEARGSHKIAHGLREILVGEDPTDVEGLWEKMYRGVIFYGRRGAAIHAISGIDIALWDLKGQAEGKPLCALLGEPVRTRVRAYASRLMPETPAEVTDAVTELREQDFTAVKLGWGPLGQDPGHDVALARAAKEAAGDDVEILIDAGLGYGADAAAATRVARGLEELGIFWLEEPFEPNEYEAYAELADR